jgi:hypothetical protein
MRCWGCLSGCLCGRKAIEKEKLMHTLFQMFLGLFLFFGGVYLAVWLENKMKK